MAAPRGGLTAAHEIASDAAAGALALTFPDDCRVCGARLTDFSRLPVCFSCLAPPAPLSAEAFCTQCRAPFLSESSLDLNGRCRLCRSGGNHFDAVYCVGAYEGRLRKLIHLFKYAKIRTLAKPLGRFLRSGLPLEARFDYIVPTPMHWTRRWQRGFNQAELLALEVGRSGAVPVADLLRRARRTPKQANLGGKERRKNVKGAFDVRPGRYAGALNGKRILLVDDVMTTGATVNACALTLKNAGAAYVAVLALARADRRVGPGSESDSYSHLALANFSSSQFDTGASS
jgi:ComF family protein